MIITIKVITRAHANIVKKSEDGTYKVYVTVIAEKGKANAAVQKLLAKYFGVSKTSVQILRGKTAHVKQIAIKKVK